MPITEPNIGTIDDPYFGPINDPTCHLINYPSDDTSYEPTHATPTALYVSPSDTPSYVKTQTPIKEPDSYPISKPSLDLDALKQGIHIETIVSKVESWKKKYISVMEINNFQPNNIHPLSRLVFDITKNSLVVLKTREYDNTSH